MIQLADLWDRGRGTPPKHGGSEDQLQHFVDAAQFVWADRARWRADLKLRHEDV